MPDVKKEFPFVGQSPTYIKQNSKKLWNHFMTGYV